jgi:hypothetical protein
MLQEEIILASSRVVRSDVTKLLVRFRAELLLSSLSSVILKREHVLVMGRAL